MFSITKISFLGSFSVLFLNFYFFHSKNTRNRVSWPSQPTWRTPARSTSASSLAGRLSRSARSVWRALTSKGRKRSMSSGRRSFRRCARQKRSVSNRKPKSERRSASCKNTSRSKRRPCVSDWSRSRRLSSEPKPSKTLISRYCREQERVVTLCVRRFYLYDDAFLIVL